MNRPGARHPAGTHGHHGRPHRSMTPCRGLRLKSNTNGAIASKRTRALRLLGIDLAGERVPAARLVERDIMRFAEQQRELHRFVVAHGLDRGVERQAGIALPPAVLAGRNPADAADLDLAAVPGGVAEVDADMAGEAARRAPRSARGGRHGPTRRGPMAAFPRRRRGQTALNSGSAAGHDASPFNTSISMLIFRSSLLRCPAGSSQIAVFKIDGTFYKGSR